MPFFIGVPVVAEFEFLVPEEDGARGLSQEAAYRARHFGPARAHEAGEAEDLALAEGEGDVLEEAVVGKPPHLQDALARGLSLGRIDILEVPPDHAVHEGDLVHARDARRLDEAAVAQDRHRVRDAVYLREAMTYIEDSDAFLLQGSDDAEKDFRLRLGQRRRRLIEDENLAVYREGLDDLDYLLLGHAELAHLLARVDMNVPLEIGEELLRSIVNILEIDEAPAAYGGHEDVLRYADVLAEGDLLVDEAYPHPKGVVGRTDQHLGALEEYLPLVGLVYAAYHVHQRGFPGAVLADHGVHRARATSS